MTDACGCNPATYCRLCELAARPTPKRPAVGHATVAVASPPRPLPCVHLGADTGRRETCRTCAGKVELKVLGCGVYGECTVGKAVEGIACCQGCVSYAPAAPATAAAPPAAYEFHLSARGIGDAVTGLYVACGLAKATGQSVSYFTGRAAWLADASYPGVTVVQSEERRGADANRDYTGELRAATDGTCTSRAQWYADRLADSFGSARFAPVRPLSVRKPPPILPPGYVVLSPFANHSSREWPLERWRELTERLTRGGRWVLAVSRGGEPTRRALAAGLGDLPGVVWWGGRPVEWVLAAVAHAGHFYGSDSGLTHVAGLLGTPATAVVSHLPGSFLYAEAPSVRAVSPDPAAWPCSPCGWRESRGYLPPLRVNGRVADKRCEGRCAALASVGAVPLPPA